MSAVEETKVVPPAEGTPVTADDASKKPKTDDGAKKDDNSNNNNNNNNDGKNQAKKEKGKDRKEGGGERREGGGKKKKKNKAEPVKVPKGMRDFDPLEMAIRNKVIGLVRGHFERHGAVTIETPVMELKETLMGKYGEDSKLIYELADQGGEMLALRYDLTVPFARYIALHRATSIKRYHIARVYRRDQPSVSQGRFREFYQCDFDIAGNGAPMVADSECLKLMTEILDELPLGGYRIKVNHRGLLDGMLEVCGVPSTNFRPVCSAIDKLDKEPWDKVRAELITKGCTDDMCDKIHGFVELSGDPRSLREELVKSGRFDASESAVKALEEMGVLCDYLDALRVPEGRIVFDLSLARGLDYYTGIIYEGVLTDGGSVGSICGGGRYDDLAGMFMNGNQKIPCVGFSLGLERIFAIIEAKEKKAATVRASATQVLVASMGKNMVANRLAVLGRLWDAGIAAEHMLQPNPDLRKQLGKADTDATPIAVLVGEDEWARGCVKIKVLATKEESEVEVTDLVDAIKKMI